MADKKDDKKKAPEAAAPAGEEGAPSKKSKLIFFVMIAWINGRERLLAARWRDTTPLADFMAKVTDHYPPRTAGTAIYMVPNTQVIPQTLLHSLKHFRVLHERVILMTVRTTNAPYVKDEERIEITPLGHHFYMVSVTYGFFEEPKIPRILAQIRIKEFHLKLADISFFIGRERLTSNATSLWHQLCDRIFIGLHRNMLSATEFYRIPPGHSVELGGHIEI